MVTHKANESPVIMFVGMWNLVRIQHTHPLDIYRLCTGKGQLIFNSENKYMFCLCRAHHLEPDASKAKVERREQMGTLCSAGYTMSQRKNTYSLWNLHTLSSCSCVFPISVKTFWCKCEAVTTLCSRITAVKNINAVKKWWMFTHLCSHTDLRCGRSASTCATY